MKISELLNEQAYSFLDRCEAIRTKISQAAEPELRDHINRIPIELSSDPEDLDKVYSLTSSGKVVIDEAEFKDAPVSVLIFLIAHELAHILQNHFGNDQVPASHSQMQELEADRWATRITLKLGLNKVPVFTWLHRHKDQEGRTELQRRQELERNPNNAEFFKDQSHPTIDRRIQQGRELGVEISRPNTDQINWLLQHMA